MGEESDLATVRAARMTARKSILSIRSLWNG